MSTIRVLLLMHGLHLTGAPRVVLDAFDALKGRDIQVWTLALQGGALEKRCRELGPLDIVGDPGHTVSTVKRLVKREQRPGLAAALRGWRPDLIYVNSVAALPIQRFVPLPDAPTLVHVHELHSYLSHYAERFPDEMLRRPARYLAVSQAVRQALVDFLKIDDGRIALVNEFVPEESIAATESLLRVPEAASPERPFVMGGAGRVDMRKGPTLWLQTAAALLKRMGPARVRFVWVGMGDDDNSRFFRMMADRLGLTPHVTFVPVTPEPLPHYAGFDVFAMTSWEDPCPIVVLEAMLLGKPVACFAGSGGAPEEVGETGLVVDGFAPEAMAASIAGLLEGDPAHRAALGRAARERVKQVFSASAQVPRIEEEIRRLVGGGK